MATVCPAHGERSLTGSGGDGAAGAVRAGLAHRRVELFLLVGFAGFRGRNLARH